MGIYFEDKLVRPKKDGDEIEVMVYEGYQRVEQMFKEKKGVIVLDRDFVEKKDTTGQNSMPAPPIALPMSVPLYLDSLGAINIRYSKSAPQRTNDGKSVIYPSARLLVYDKMILTEREKDLAYFMLEATEFIEKKDNYNPSAFLKINDPELEVADKVSKLKRNALVDAYLLREDSVLFNEKSLQAIADRFGIVLETDSKEVNAYMLREAIVKGDEPPRNSDVNIDKFLDYAKKIEAKLTKDNPKKETKVKVEELGANTGVNEPLKYGMYTEDYLNNLNVAERNQISKDLELDYPPKCRKEEQVMQILEKQAVDKVN